MSLRFLATADNHFEERSERWAETLRVHDGFATLVERERPDGVLLGGDFWERASTPLERLQVREMVRAVCRWAPAVAVRGNHDVELDGDSLLDKLQTDRPFTFATRPAVISIQPGVDVATVPWPSRAGAIDDGSARAALQTVLGALGAEMGHRAASYRIALGHLDISGAESGIGQPIIGGSVRVALTDLALLGVQAVVAGHIHKPQGWTLGSTPVAYCGSPVAHDWGEIEAKSFLDLRWDAVGAAFVVERIPTGARRLVHAAGRYDEATGDVVEIEMSGGGGADAPTLTGADVRLRYRVRPEHVEPARRFVEGEGGLCDRWKALGACRVAPEQELVTTVRARSGATEVSAAPTLAEQLVAYWQVREDAPPPERQQAMLGRLAELGAR